MLTEEFFDGLNIMNYTKSNKKPKNTTICQKVKKFLEKLLFCLNILIYLN